MSEGQLRFLDDKYLTLLETYATSPVVSDVQLAAVAREELPGLIARIRQLGFVIEDLGGLNCPILVCAVCRERILDARDAWAYFVRLLAKGQRSGVAFVHKTSPCLDAFLAPQYEKLGTREATHVLMQLLFNVGIAIDDVHELDAEARELEF